MAQVQNLFTDSKHRWILSLRAFKDSLFYSQFEHLQINLSVSNKLSFILPQYHYSVQCAQDSAYHYFVLFQTFDAEELGLLLHLMNTFLED